MMRSLPLELMREVLGQMPISARAACQEWRYIYDDNIRNECEQKLMHMLQSTHIHRRCLPIVWYLRYVHGRDTDVPVYKCARCYGPVLSLASCQACRNVLHVFPWKRCLAGPMVAVCAAVTVRVFLRKHFG